MQIINTVYIDKYLINKYNAIDKDLENRHNETKLN